MIKEIEFENKKVFLKKDKTGIRVVYPYKNSDGTFNWFNFLTGGSWFNLIKTLLIVFLILAICFAYYQDTKTCFKAINENTYYQKNYGSVPNQTFIDSLPQLLLINNSYS